MCKPVGRRGGNLTAQQEKLGTPKGVPSFLVAGTGCGCPVDTSVQSTEAPTEAAAETLNLFARRCRLPSCGARNLFRLGAAINFDRCANKLSLHRPPDAGEFVAPETRRSQG